MVPSHSTAERALPQYASGFGGAIYNTRSITLNPGAGQEIVFSGNTDSTGSNAIFMGDGSSLDIMGDGKVVFDDALSSQSATPTLKKTGSGELLLNASMDGFLGTASFEGGLTGIAEKWLIKNLVTIAGGKLKMPEFSLRRRTRRTPLRAASWFWPAASWRRGQGRSSPTA